MFDRLDRSPEMTDRIVAHMGSLARDDDREIGDGLSQVSRALGVAALDLLVFTRPSVEHSFEADRRQ